MHPCIRPGITTNKKNKAIAFNFIFENPIFSLKKEKKTLNLDIPN